MNKRLLGKRIIVMLISIVLLSCFVSLNSIAGFGIDPYSSLGMGISSSIGMSFGLLMFLLNLAILIIALFLGKHLIGFGTLINMCIGFGVDYTTPALLSIIPDAWEGQLIFRIITLTIGMLVGSFAAALYFTTELGVGPYDTIALILTEKTKIHFRWCRIFCDGSCALIAFFLGATIGIGTVISAAFLGPLISFFTRTVAIPLLKPEEVEKNK